MGSTGQASAAPKPAVDASTTPGKGLTMSQAGAVMMGASSLANAYSQSQALEAQGAYQKQVAETNSRLAEVQAQDAIARGDISASEAVNKGNAVVGAQRTAIAANGIDVNSGTARSLQTDTNALSHLDALTIKNNAWREAWGYKMQAVQSTAQGQFASIAARNASSNTLLTGGLQAAAYGIGAGDTSNRPLANKNTGASAAKGGG